MTRLKSHPIKRKSFGIKTKKKRRKKGELTKLKDKLWDLMRHVAAEKYPHTCYTCETPLRWGSSWMQLGHFIARSESSQELVYDLLNTRWQCMTCNKFKHGRWYTFECNLTRDCGVEYVEELKRRNKETKGKTFPLDWYRAKIAEYENLLKEKTESTSVSV